MMSRADQIPSSRRPTKVVLVDDDDQVRQVLARLLQGKGYEVFTADGTDNALRLLQQEGEVALVVSDLHMPERDGLDLLRELKVQYPATAVIMLTGDGDIATAVTCLTQGAADYLTKPVVNSEFQARIAKALADRERAIELRRLRESFEQDLQRQLTELSHKNKAMFISQIQMAVTILETRDPYTRGHSKRVADYAVAIGRALHLDPHTLDELQLGAELHDIGKIGTPDAVLGKTGPLTPEETAEIRRHPIDGEMMLSSLREDHPLVLQMVRWHHERMDGAGFPDGLKGEEIPLVALIVSVVDAFDAMTTTRQYRSEQPSDTAMEELQRGAGAQFDPAIVAAFAAMRGASS